MDRALITCATIYRDGALLIRFFYLALTARADFQVGTLSQKCPRKRILKDFLRDYYKFPNEIMHIPLVITVTSCCAICIPGFAIYENVSVDRREN